MWSWAEPNLDENGETEMITRRTLLKQAGIIAGAAGARIIPAGAILQSGIREAPAAAVLANAVLFPLALNTPSAAQLIIDATKLVAAGLPITMNRAFFSTAYELTHSLPVTYPGKMSLIGNADAAGHPSFVINILPPNPIIPGSLTNPMLQVLLAADSAMTKYVSFIVPEFAAATGNFHTVQVSIGILPTSPPRWTINVVDIDQKNFNILVNGATGKGYFTNPLGNVLASQIPPPSFNVPLITTGLPSNDKYVYWIGQPITSALGGYKPVIGNLNYLYALAGKLSQTYLHLTPIQNVDLGYTLPQFINVAGYRNQLFAAVQASTTSAVTAGQINFQLSLAFQTPTYNALAQQLSALASSLTNTLNAATIAGASVSVQAAIMQAQAAANLARTNASQAYSANYVGSATATANAVAAVAANVVAVETYLAESLQLASATMTPSQATSANVHITSTSTATATTIYNGSGPPQLYLNGNAGTATQISTGAQVAGNSSSYYQNQVNGGISLSTPGGATPVQQSPDDSGVTIESITITPMP